MSINNDVEIKVALDTSEAVQAVDQLATKMPKSLEKMIKRFQKIDRLIDKAWNTKDQSQKMIRTFSEVGSAFKDLTEEIEKDSKKIGKSFNNLTKKDAFRGLSDKTKESGRNIALFQKRVLNMNKALMGVFSNINENSFMNSNNQRQITDSYKKKIQQRIRDIKETAKKLGLAVEIDQKEVIKRINEQFQSIDASASNKRHMKRTFSGIIAEWTEFSEDLKSSVRETAKDYKNNLKNFNKALEEIENLGRFKRGRQYSNEERKKLIEEENRVFKERESNFKNAMDKIQKLNASYQAEFGKSINIKDLTKTMLGKDNVGATRKMIKQKIKEAENSLNRAKELEEKAKKQIEATGRFSRTGIHKKMQDKLIKEEVAAQSKLEKRLTDVFDDSMKNIEKKGNDFDRRRNQFIAETMQKIRSGKSDIKSFGSSDDFFKDIVAAQQKKFSAESQKILAREYGLRGSDFRKEAEEMMAHANRLQKLEATVGKDRVDQARKFSERIREGNTKELLAFRDGKEAMFKQYKDDLANQKRYFDEKIREKKNSISRLSLIHDRTERARQKKELEDLREHRRNLQIEQNKLNALGKDGASRFFSGGRGGGGGGSSELVLGGGRGGMPNTAIERYDRNLQLLERSGRRLQRTFAGLNSAIYAFGAGLGVHSLTQYYDQWVQFSNRVRLVSSSMQEMRDIQNELIEVSNRTATSLFATGGLFEKFSRAGDRYGVSTDLKAALSQLVQQTVSISGATTEGAKGAIIQFVQGLGTELRGQELASVREQIPRLARAIADGLDVPISMLKKLGEQGVITGDQIMLALIKQLPVIEREFKNISFTISQSFERITNSLSELLGRTMDDLNSTKGVSEFFTSISEAIRDLTKRGTLSQLFKSMYELRDILTTIAKTLAAAFITSKTLQLAGGLGGGAAALAMGAGMNFRAAGNNFRGVAGPGAAGLRVSQRARNFGGGILSLFGGGYVDSQGKEFTSSERKQMIDDNKKIREKNRSLPFEERQRPLDVPQRRVSFTKMVRNVGLVTAALAVTATALSSNSKALDSLVNNFFTKFSEFFKSVGSFIDSAAIKLGLYKTDEQTRKEAAEKEIRKSQASLQLTRRGMPLADSQDQQARLQGLGLGTQKIYTEKEIRAQVAKILQKREQVQELRNDTFLGNWMMPDGSPFDSEGRVAVIEKYLAEQEKKLQQMIATRTTYNGVLIESAEDQQKIARMQFAITMKEIELNSLNKGLLEDRKSLYADLGDILGK